MMDSSSFFSHYSSFRNKNISGRYLPPEKLLAELEHLKKHFRITEIGRSGLDRPIHSVRIGEGPVKILGWSQMHGNESTTTKGLLDLFNLLAQPIPGFEADKILSGCTLLFIPMLNPDGAEAYTRENARGVDLNRDAANLQEPESRVLREEFERFKPDFCLNLHDQRSIFGAGEIGKPATLSFLAPAMNEARDLNETRKLAMQVIALLNAQLQRIIPGAVGRFDDSFNENCSGDYFQKSGTPTILFEAGHFPEDYMREKTRQLVTYSLYSSLLSMASKDYSGLDVSGYYQIPENKKNFCDVTFRKASYRGEIVDVALQYREQLADGKINFIPEIHGIDKKLLLFAHREINCDGGALEMETEQNTAPEKIVVCKIMLNGSELSIKL